MRQFYQIDYFENLDLRFATVRPYSEPVFSSK